MNKVDWRMGSSIVEIYLTSFFLAAVRRPRPSGDPDRSASPTHSVGHIFRCTTKDMEERRVKGTAVPLNPLGVIVTPFAESVPDVFALVPRPNFNQGRRSAYPRPFVPTAL